MLGTDRSAARLTDLTRMYEAGQPGTPVWKTFPLGQAADAHREVEAGHVRGKVALTVR